MVILILTIMVSKAKFTPVISSKDIEDKYLTQIISVSKLLQVSTKDKIKYERNLERHKVLANRNFDNSTKADMFAKAYGFSG